jgi:hypothetical protein
MLTNEELQKMRQDATLALSRSYGYPEARLNCARHVEALLEEIERCQAALAVAHGDWSVIRKLAG